MYDSKFRKFFLKRSNNILKLSPPVRQFWRYHGNRGFNILLLQYLPFLLYKMIGFKVARYSFLGSIPPTFEHKLRRNKQSFGKIANTVVLDKDENLLWSWLERHRSCHSKEMTLLPILLAALYLGTGNCSSKIVHGSFFLQ